MSQPLALGVDPILMSLVLRAHQLVLLVLQSVVRILVRASLRIGSVKSFQCPSIKFGRLEDQAISRVLAVLDEEVLKCVRIDLDGDTIAIGFTNLLNDGCLLYTSPSPRD